MNKIFMGVSEKSLINLFHYRDENNHGFVLETIPLSHDSKVINTYLTKDKASEMANAILKWCDDVEK